MERGSGAEMEPSGGWSWHALPLFGGGSPPKTRASLPARYRLEEPTEVRGPSQGLRLLALATQIFDLSSELHALSV